MKTCYQITLRISVLAFMLIAANVINSGATTHNVNVSNFVFTPSSMTINLGDTVKWTWVNGEHTTSSTTIPVGAAVWNNPVNAPNPSFKYVPAVIGTYNYKCNIHPLTMLASFTVICPTPTVSISAGGPTTFCKGGSVTLSKSSAGTFSSFQWKLDGADISGSTASTFTATAKGSYTLVATNSCGNSATSNAIVVTVNKKPNADVTPAGPIDICAGGTVLLTVGTAGGQTYQWKKGNANISGATTSTLLVSAAGTYKCVVTKTSTGCTKTSNKVTVNITCKMENQAMEATAFPNPSADYFLLNTASLSMQNGLIRIYDLTGKLMETYSVQNETTIEVGRNLPSGVYFAKIEAAGNVLQVLKLMKN